MSTGQTSVVGAGGRAAEEDERAGLSSDLQQHIGNRLRALYDGVVNEPLPDRLMSLLSQLDAPASPAASDEPESRA